MAPERKFADRSARWGAGEYVLSGTGHPGGLPVRTASICPECKRVLEAELVERDGRVVLDRACPEHGRFDAVVYGDAQRYREIQRFNKPGEEPLERQTELRAAARTTAASAPSTRSTPASGSSRSTPPATSTARSASPTRAPGPPATATR